MSSPVPKPGLTRTQSHHSWLKNPRYRRALNSPTARRLVVALLLSSFLASGVSIIYSSIILPRHHPVTHHSTTAPSSDVGPERDEKFDQKSAFDLATDFNGPENNPDNRHLDVAMAFASGDVDGAATVCASLLSHIKHRKAVKFHLIVPYSEEKDLRRCTKLRKVCGNVRFVPIMFSHVADLKIRHIVEFFGPDRARPFDFAKIFLPSLLPNLTKVLYLDPNVLVRADLTPLWAVPLYRTEPVACVPAPELRDEKYDFLRKWRDVPKVIAKATWFRPNLFVANLNAWRRLNYTQTMAKWSRRNARQGIFNDTVAGPMNGILGSLYKPLDPHWLVPASTTNASLFASAKVLLFPPYMTAVRQPTLDPPPDVLRLRNEASRHVDCEVRHVDPLVYPQSLRDVINEAWIAEWLAKVGYRGTSAVQSATPDRRDSSANSPTPDGNINIILSFSVGHARGAYALCRSLLANARRSSSLRFYLLVAEGEEEQAQQCGQRFCGPETQAKAFNAKLMRHLNLTAERGWRQDLLHPMNVARFFIADVFSQLSRAIYLDVDMICVDDVQKIWDVELSDGHLGAFVPDDDLKEHMLNPQACSNVSFEFFNAGLYLANLNAWRRHQVADKCMRLLIDNFNRNVFKGVTQGPLNFVIGSRYTALNTTWNVRSWRDKAANITDVLASTRLLHWAGSHKPYAVNGTFVPGYEIFQQYAVEDSDCVAPLLQIQSDD